MVTSPSSELPQLPDVPGMGREWHDARDDAVRVCFENLDYRNVTDDPVLACAVLACYLMTDARMRDAPATDWRYILAEQLSDAVTDRLGLAFAGVPDDCEHVNRRARGIMAV